MYKSQLLDQNIGTDKINENILCNMKRKGESTSNQRITSYAAVNG